MGTCLRCDLPMPSLPWSRLSFPTALMAVFSFVSGFVLACLSVPEYQPGQHPLVLLGTLPGLQGGLFRWLIFILPGLLMGASALCLSSRWLQDRWGRVAQQLAVIAAFGFMLMGMLGIDQQGPLDAAMRAQAAAWLLWLSASAAAMLLLAVAAWRSAVSTAAWLGLLTGMGVLLLSLLPLPASITGPLLQLLAWLVWMCWAVALARLGAGRRP